MKRTFALICALTLAGCSTTPEQNAAIVDAIQGAASNFNASADGAGRIPTDEGAQTNTPALPSHPAPAPITNAPTTAPSSPLDALDISKARTISKYVKNIPAMPVRGELRNVKLTGDRVTFETSGEPWLGEWGRIAIIWQDGAELIAGEFDAVKPGRGTRLKGLENIHGGYIQNRQPAKGQAVYFVLYDMKGTQRSNVAAGGVWK
jgi:hypothetical protein